MGCVGPIGFRIELDSVSLFHRARQLLYRFLVERNGCALLDFLMTAEPYAIENAVDRPKHHGFVSAFLDQPPESLKRRQHRSPEVLLYYRSKLLGHPVRGGSSSREVTYVGLRPDLASAVELPKQHDALRGLL